MSDLFKLDALLHKDKPYKVKVRSIKVKRLANTHLHTVFLAYWVDLPHSFPPDCEFLLTERVELRHVEKILIRHGFEQQYETPTHTHFIHKERRDALA